jgi:hypothetical protein
LLGKQSGYLYIIPALCWKSIGESNPSLEDENLLS